MQNPPRVEAPKKDPSGKVRNLTHEGVRAHLAQNKAAEMAACPPFEIVKLHLPKRDAKGNVIKDEHGFVELIEKTVLKRDVIAAEWDDKMACYPA